jgi:hypothetical protein
MSIVYRSVKGSKLTSNEVDGNFQYLENLVGGQGNSVVAETGFSLVAQDLTIAPGWVWQILNTSYTNASSVVLNIPFATSGNERIDLIVANQSNTFERIAGIESVSNPSAPSLPSNKILVTFITVSDGVIGNPSAPIIGTQFKKKSEAAAYTDPTLSGADAVVELQPNGQSVYAFSNAGLTSIDGFGLDLITGNPSAEVPYNGKDILVYNNKAGNLTLKHDGSGTADVKFLLEGAVDLVIPAGGKVWLKYGPSYCEMIFKSWTEIDLSTKADLIDGKVPASQLPNGVGDIIIAKVFTVAGFGINTTNQWYTFNHPFLTATWNTSFFYGSDVLPTFAIDYKDKPALINSFGKPLKSMIWAIDYGDWYELDICIIKTDSISNAQVNHRAVLMPYHIRVLTTTPSLNHPGTAPYSKYQIEIPVNDASDTPSNAFNSAYHVFIKGQASAGSNRTAIYFKF